MADAKYTKGQWARAHAGFEQTPCLVAKRAGRPVTVATFKSGNRAEDEANAQLCSAALAMLDAIGPAITALAFEQERALRDGDKIAFVQITQAKDGLIRAHAMALGRSFTGTEIEGQAGKAPEAIATTRGAE